MDASIYLQIHKLLSFENNPCYDTIWDSRKYFTMIELREKVWGGINGNSYKRFMEFLNLGMLKKVERDKKVLYYIDLDAIDEYVNKDSIIADIKKLIKKLQPPFS